MMPIPLGRPFGRPAAWCILLLVSCVLISHIASAGPPADQEAPALRTLRLPVAPAETLFVQVSNELPVQSSSIVVLLPGPVGSAFAMRHVARILTDSGHRVVIVDPLGMGASSRPKHADYALSTQARRVHRVIDAVLPSNTPFVVAGIGSSATIALHLAANMPDRVRGVVSIAGGGNDTQGTTGLRLALALGPLLDTPMGRAFARRRFASTARAQSADASWVTSASVAGYLGDAERDVRGTLSTLQRMADSQEPQPIGPRLSTITAPVVLLVGDKPKVNSPTSAQREALASGLRHFRIDTLTGAGAMLHEERPIDIVAHLLRLGPRP